MPKNFFLVQLTPIFIKKNLTHYQPQEKHRKIHEHKSKLIYYHTNDQTQSVVPCQKGPADYQQKYKNIAKKKLVKRESGACSEGSGQPITGVELSTDSCRLSLA